MIHLRPIPAPEEVAAQVIRDLEETKLRKQIARSPDKVTRHLKAANDYRQNGGQ